MTTRRYAWWAVGYGCLCSSLIVEAIVETVQGHYRAGGVLVILAGLAYLLHVRSSDLEDRLKKDSNLS